MGMNVGNHGSYVALAGIDSGTSTGESNKRKITKLQGFEGKRNSKLMTEIC